VLLRGVFFIDHFREDGSSDGVLSRMVRLMEVLDCSDGVIDILGNREFIETVPDFEAKGITMLMNESLAIERGEHRVWLVGSDDAHYYKVDDIALAMNSVDYAQPVVLLVHSPRNRQLRSAGAHQLPTGHQYSPIDSIIVTSLKSQSKQQNHRNFKTTG
jgi:predicted MPP superfamily phosphohydrolase